MVKVARARPSDGIPAAATRHAGAVFQARVFVRSLLPILRTMPHHEQTFSPLCPCSAAAMTVDKGGSVHVEIHR
jgi:hypothetical protein